MKIKRVMAVCLLLATLLSLGGCADQAVPTDLGTKIDPQEISTELSYHLRDNVLMYDQYSDTEVVTMYLTVSRGNEAEGTYHTWADVNSRSAYYYDEMGIDRFKVAGLLQVGNEEGLIPGEFGYGQVAPNCTVQIRGQSSSRNEQKNYKIAIKDNKGEWRGQRTIALNKHQGDGLRFRNKLGFDLIRHIDELMGLRTTFVHLYVKDTTEFDENAKFEDYGLYTQVEQLNKTALKAHGLDNRGHLYKVNFCEFYRYEDVIMLKDDPNYDLKAFEEILEVKGDDDHTKLIDMLETVNDYSVPIEDILEEKFDMENITYWMAFNLLLGNMDTQSRNFYLYSPQNIDRWYILPWDLDGSLAHTENTYKGRYDYESWESGVSNYWGNVLFRRCLKSEVFRDALKSAVEDLRQVLSPELVGSYVDTYSALVKPYVYTGRDQIHAPITSPEYDAVAANINAEIADNYQRYLDSYEKPMPFYIGMPQKIEGTDQFTVQWEAAYDFDGEDVTYTFELSRDYNFGEVMETEDDLEIPTVTIDRALRPGQYFMRVTAKNESGYTQHAFDYYILANGKVYGVKSFFVNEKGELLEDVYVEE